MFSIKHYSSAAGYVEKSSKINTKLESESDKFPPLSFAMFQVKWAQTDTHTLDQVYLCFFHQYSESEDSLHGPKEAAVGLLWSPHCILFQQFCKFKIDFKTFLSHWLQ